MTFAVFFMNADRTIYGRFETRSEYELATKEMSLPGLRIALERALRCIKNTRKTKPLLAKTGPTPKQKVPEDFPSLRSYKSNILWRATTWEMNRMVGGSLKWANFSAADRTKLGLAPNATAIRVDFVGWWGPYQAGKRAGFLKDDVMISFDGQRNRKTVNEFYAYAMNQTVKGNDIAVEILRNGKKMTLQLPMQ